MKGEISDIDFTKKNKNGTLTLDIQTIGQFSINGKMESKPQQWTWKRTWINGEIVNPKNRFTKYNIRALPNSVNGTCYVQMKITYNSLDLKNE